MTEIQKKAATWGGVVTGLMILFPPWQVPGGPLAGTSRGYSPLWDAPAAAEVDLARLFLQVVLVAIAVGVWLAWRKSK